MADPTTVEDVIAEAVGLALPRSLQPVGASLREPPEFGGTITGYGQQIVDAITPAVVAAIRDMTRAQLFELTGFDEFTSLRARYSLICDACNHPLSHHMGSGKGDDMHLCRHCTCEVKRGVPGHWITKPEFDARWPGGPS